MDPSNVLTQEEIKIRSDLSYEEELIRILDREVKVLKNKMVPLVKILWHKDAIEEPSWETEEGM